MYFWVPGYFRYARVKKAHAWPSSPSMWSNLFKSFQFKSFCWTKSYVSSAVLYLHLRCSCWSISIYKESHKGSEENRIVCCNIDDLLVNDTTGPRWQNYFSVFCCCCCMLQHIWCWLMRITTALLLPFLNNRPEKAKLFQYVLLLLFIGSKIFVIVYWFKDFCCCCWFKDWVGKVFLYLAAQGARIWRHQQFQVDLFSTFA